MIVNAVIFIFGLIIGSFLNVIIYRLPEDKSIIFPRSRCTSCQTELGVIDLIPIVSFLLTKGRCRYCGAKISYQYPLVEFLTGIIFLLLFQQYYFSIQFMIYAFLSSLLLTAAVIDLKHQIIPNRITYFGIITGLILSLLFKHITIRSALLGLVIPAGFLLLIAVITKGGLGMGDVKFIAMIGTYLGAKYTLISIFIGSIVGSVIGLALIGLGVKSRKDRVPFGPLLALGNLLMILYGQVIMDWYLSYKFGMLNL
ncbi:prepilin peptidase [Acetohalobium arabaticum]|uniref:Peptidase A24A domain protein n=1 Tax=Acetohalobium arabaticum (strain ATCC 49924 / DSM 5501 / Z-7288) TaxID=574087 RepID=D9QRY2_ACEAZ|nr:A24 family peptidase [Acetohalobium arabaticum]ADL13273.1 peptidase A24A domain protein [Acetohalobium arabaticum DSM 5501]